jgi:RNA 2'-phosphotransferase, Tpt1 / KptA family
MRRDISILIYLDVKQALEGNFQYEFVFSLLFVLFQKLMDAIYYIIFFWLDGIKLYLSDNKVILTEDFNGLVPVKYFAKIETWPRRMLVPLQC